MTVVRAIGRLIAAYYSIPLLLLIYEATSRLHLVSPRLLPSLVDIAAQLWRYLANGIFLYHAKVTLIRAFVGFALALAGGAVIGTAMARSRVANAVIEPIFTFGFPVPKIALYPVLLFVFGLTDGLTIALVVLECIYPIAIHVNAGLRSADQVLVWAARGMGATRRQIFRKVLVPAALPTVFTGLRIALPVALIVTLVTEIIGQGRGLGYLVTFASASFENARALAALFVIAVVGFFLDRGLLTLRDHIVFWQKRPRTS